MPKHTAIHEKLTLKIPISEAVRIDKIPLYVALHRLIGITAKKPNNRPTMTHAS